MGDVLQFTPRPKPVTADFPSEPLTGPALRASLEEAAQVALDAADRIIAVLDRLDGDADHEDGGDAEPSLAALENATGSQVVWLRGNDPDREADSPEFVPSEIRIKPTPESFVLPWGGRGNVLSAVGTALLDFMNG